MTYYTQCIQIRPIMLQLYNTNYAFLVILTMSAGSPPTPYPQNNNNLVAHKSVLSEHDRNYFSFIVNKHFVLRLHESLGIMHTHIHKLSSFIESNSPTDMFWEVGGNQRTQRKSMQTCEEHAKLHTDNNLSSG